MERKLATIRRVKEIKPIEGADNIELAVIDGWQCVVKKGEFKTGDLGVYFEIDSLLPCVEPFLFLESRGRKTNADGSEGYRIKTMKMRGVISQGLLMPVRAFPELHIHDYALPLNASLENVLEGIDITELFGIKKYEAPIPAQLQGQVKGSFPGVIRKTDEERIQNLPEYFELYKEDHFEETEKIDGSSVTVYFNNGEFGVCSRNLELKENEFNAYWKMANELDLKNIMSKGPNMAIQGELAGEGIQANPLKIRGQKFFVYKIWNIDTQTYYNVGERQCLFTELQKVIKNEKFQHVPLIKNKANTFYEFYNMEKLLEYANGPSKVNNAVMREGIVFKSYEHPEISFKAISNKYLLKHEE